ncbi:hypothetical protein DVV95_06125 [Clostridium botulinum]|uniref:hypothetical protein n=1 Tax=Clostridium botulinum TaxID=1491 RepID=UPI0019677790|nr:hypothetical protein [Clostridium botulinum]MBN1061397.1 hypothetical protein [Clostridium botulinum]
MLLLNISSVKGKEHKLGFASNRNIRRYKPPFKIPSFIKLDALYIIDNSDDLKQFLLSNGRCIHPQELKEIKEKFEEYRENNNIYESNIDISNILKINSITEKEIENENIAQNIH